MFAREIAAATAEYRVPREVVDRLLITAGLAGIEPAAIPGAFDELARRFAAMRDALQQQRNDDPGIASLKQQAGNALAAADLDAAERLLAVIRGRQRTLSERRRRAADEAHADFVAALEEEADTCAQQAGAALLRFDLATATRFYQDGVAVLAEAPTDARWRYALNAANSLQELGDRAGRNDALLASISLYRTCSARCRPQIGCRSTGRRRRTISATRSRGLASGREGRRLEEQSRLPCRARGTISGTGSSSVGANAKRPWKCARYAWGTTE